MAQGRHSGAVGAGEFQILMADVGLGHPPPPLAVAVSGGGDSMALALLVARWAGPGAAIVALIVDHGLREGSATEVRRVAEWLGQRGIANHVLTWHGDKPVTGIQAAARAARYRLLKDCCRSRAIGHLLLGHHREDQAETLLMRLGRGSGVDGLAAMAPVSAQGSPRLLRPLLAMPRARLRTTLVAMGQDWIEDPGNRDPAHARTRMRRALEILAPEGLSPARLAATAGRLRRARAALETATADCLNAGAAISDRGYIRFDAGGLLAVPEEISLRALAAMVMTVGGGRYRPRLRSLEQLLGALGGPGPIKGRTLAGCLIRPCPRRLARGPRDLVICREPRAVEGPVALSPGHARRWDARFQVTLEKPDSGGENPTGEVGALGGDGWRALRQAFGVKPAEIPPAGVGITLPAMRVAGEVVAVPHFGYVKPGAPPVAKGFRAGFAPRLVVREAGGWRWRLGG